MRRPQPTARARAVAVAAGEVPADLLLSNARIVNVFTAEVIDGCVAVAGNLIAAVGVEVEAVETLDLEGRLLCPGLIDAHVHMESSMVTPFELARAIVPRGTTTVVCDPHEIANVAGMAGVEWLLEASHDLPLEVLVNAPSCVPASPLATAGARLNAADLEALRAHPRVLGLAEVMNVPGVVGRDPEVWAKLTSFADAPVDGHAPGISGGRLNAYVAAGPGSDHESVEPDEALAKLRLGMRVLLREGSGAKNLVDLLPAVTTASSHRCALCTDDRHPQDVDEQGHMDHLLRLAVAHGVAPVTALQMATVNAAEAFGLIDRGAVVPGRRADLVVCDDLDRFEAGLVFSGGRLVARDGRPRGDWVRPRAPDQELRGRMAVDLGSIDLAVRAPGNAVRVIGIVADQIVTEHLVEHLPRRADELVADPARDLAKLAVVDRHHGSGRVGLGFVRGLGLARGALASTVAHDHHNLVVAGVDDLSMTTAAAAVVATGGGLAVAEGEHTLAVMALPLAGLMSDLPLSEARREMDHLLSAARGLGCAGDPFMTLSFLALEVIPSLKLTDRGLVDVERFEIVPLAVE